MYTLSTLPQELLDNIINFLDVQDLVSLARTNCHYRYWLSTVLSKRIKEFEEKDGWRINVDILAKTHPLAKDMSSCLFSNDLLLLSKFCGVDPTTLTIKFNLYPLDEEGFGPLKGAGPSERSLAIFNKITTNINVVAYFAQITPGKNIKFINQAGSALIDDVALWKKLSNAKNSEGVTLMKSGFSLSYNLSTDEGAQTCDVVEKYKTEYSRFRHKQDDLSGKTPATVCFEEVHVSPEFWLKQMEGSADIVTLVVKNLPDFINQSEELQRKYFQPYKPVTTRFMQSRSMPGFVFIDFVDRNAAEVAFENLNKINFGLYFKPIQVEYARPDPHRQTLERTSQALEKDNQLLEPIAPVQGVNYPANPHLRYQYPDPTPDIITNIAYALTSVPRLYTQTLHLMNKMNLTSPFGSVKKEFQPSAMKKRKPDELLASDESELDDQDEDTSKEQEIRVKEARQLRIAAEKQRLVLKKAKINDPIQQIQHRCLSSHELSNHSVFKNYEAGTPSTRLYIKNLNKKTTEHELTQIYSVFCKDAKVNLMRKGKLKDQAFVNFSDEKTAKLALESTNGYVLHDRPMAVLFSKSK